MNPCGASASGTRIQRTISTRNPAAKKPSVTPRRRPPDRSHHPHTSPSPTTDHYGDATASLTRNWASAAAQRQHAPTPNPNITGYRDSNRTEGLKANTTLYTAASPLSLPPTPPTENTGDVRYQSRTTQEPTMATPGASLEALKNLQADELEKLIERLQGIAVSRTGTTPTAPQPPHAPPRDNKV